MKQITLSAETVVGNPTDTRWSQVHSEILQSGKCSVFVVVELAGGELLDLPHFGSSLIEEIRAGALDVTNRSLEGLKKVVSERGEEIPEGVECSVVGVMVVGDVMYAAGRGNIDLLLSRNGQSAVVFEGREEILSVSGRVQNGDVFMVGTHEFFGVIEDEILERVMREGEGASEMLAPLIVGQEDSSGMAGVVVSVGEREEAEDKVGVGGSVRDALSAAMTRVGRPELKVKREVGRRRNTVIVSVLLVLLVVSVIFGLIRRSSIVSESKYRDLEQTITSNMEEVRSIADLNPQRAKFLIDESRGRVDQYIAEEGEDGYVEEAKTLYTLIDTTETEALKLEEVDVSVLIETDILDSGLDARGMYIDEEGTLYVYGSGDVVYGVGTSDRSSFEIEGMGGVREIAEYEGSVYGVRENDVIRSDGDSVSTIIENDDFWEDVRLIDIYGGSVYLMDRGAGEIWSYPALDEGYGARRRWLGTGIVLDFSNVVDMRIDGDIWIITSTGKLERYRRGVPIEFSMEGFPAQKDDGSLSDPKAVFITEESVYVLESGASRLVKFGIEGGYQSQYVSEELSGARDMVVYEGVAYILLDGQIVSIGL